MNELNSREYWVYIWGSGDYPVVSHTPRRSSVSKEDGLLRYYNPVDYVWELVNEIHVIEKSEFDKLAVELQQKNENGCCIVEHGYRMAAEHEVKRLKAELDAMKEKAASVCNAFGAQGVELHDLKAENARLKEFEKLVRVEFQLDTAKINRLTEANKILRDGLEKIANWSAFGEPDSARVASETITAADALNGVTECPECFGNAEHPACPTCFNKRAQKKETGSNGR
jgi:hypothetical protein